MKRKRKSSDQIAWHYTTGSQLGEILDDGYLAPFAIDDLLLDEEPILWFSMERTWEPTATPLIAGDEFLRRATLEEARSLEKGLFRFGYPKERLLSWRELQRGGFIDPGTARLLAKSARQQGANPAQWYGTLESIEIRECRVEAEFEIGQWSELAFSRVNPEKAA